MQDDKIISLIEGYSAGTLSEEDTIIFFQWYSEAGLQEFRRLYAQSNVLPGQLPLYPAMPEDFRAQLEQAIRDYDAEQRDLRTIPLFRRYRLGWAAAILLLIGAGTFFFFQNRNPAPGHPTEVVKVQPSPDDIAPGGTKAVLTLADGRQVIIDSAHAGHDTLAVQGKTTVQHDAGVIAYNGDKQQQTQEQTQRPLYNTLTTHRGEQSPPLILADGTKVWLNALSSIRFPVAFSGNTRDVEITGEVFFEIAKNPSMPFHVKVNGMDVEALGTQFNVNAYADEDAIRTTLVEGSVRVRSEVGSQKSDENPPTSDLRPPTSVILKPGQQSVLITNHELKIVNGADINQVTAWKNGLFDFNHASLQTVLRQLSRWYDMDVKFEGQVPKRTFRGKVTRDLNLSQVIQTLRTVDINFRIEGRTLIITK